MQRKKDFEKNFNLAISIIGIFLIIWIAITNFTAVGRKARTDSTGEPVVSEKQQTTATTEVNSIAETDTALVKAHTENNLQNVNVPITMSREELLAKPQERVRVENAMLQGSINLRGLVLDDLTLKTYFRSVEQQQPVALLSPRFSDEANYLTFGFSSNDSNIIMPNENTLWTADQAALTPEQSVNFSYTNPQGLVFKVKLSLDDNYLFQVQQTIENPTSRDLVITSYGRLNRELVGVDPKSTASSLASNGFIGVFQNKVDTLTFAKLAKASYKQYEGQGGWFGFMDDYWLTAIIPESSCIYKTDLNSGERNSFKLAFACRPKLLQAHGSIQHTYQIFSGVKKLEILNQYAETHSLKLFDRAVNLGRLYFLTKPMLLLLDFLYKILNSFGASIICLTIIVRLALYPLSKKSMLSMEKMKLVKPEMDRINKLYGPKSIQGQQEIIELYKRMEINPFASLLPLLIQIPIFFALYRVLSINIDMRHAGFMGWIKDLSAADPTSFLNLFGLLPFPAPDFLHIGILPILMGFSMYLQTKLSNPAATTPETEGAANPQTTLKWMPVIFVFLFARFPSGLMIYWICSNLLSVLQQWYISKFLAAKLAIPYNPTDRTGNRSKKH